MRLFRITTPKWALDRVCDGARTHGGRWNPAGMPAMYAGTTIELCALEKFVHLDGTQSPPLCVVAIEVPDDAALFYRPAITSLPADWPDLPVPDSTQQFGGNWLCAAEQLVMLVPSVIVPEATNAVINPAHPAFAAVTLRVLRPFAFDARMFQAR